MTFAERAAILLAAWGLMIAGAVPGSATAAAPVFECGFLQENTRDGKPNRASCAMHPDRAFDPGDGKPDGATHCVVEQVKGLEDLVDVVVDLAGGTVAWTDFYHLSDHERAEMKAYFIESKGHPEALAARRSAPEVRADYAFTITAVRSTPEAAGRDRKPATPVRPPREGGEHTVMFENEFWRYVLYIPGDGGEAVLTEFGGIGGRSWVRIRFGTCRPKGG